LYSDTSANHERSNKCIFLSPAEVFKAATANETPEPESEEEGIAENAAAAAAAKEDDSGKEATEEETQREPKAEL
jgi:hypothetical protein